MQEYHGPDSETLLAWEAGDLNRLRTFWKLPYLKSADEKYLIGYGDITVVYRVPNVEVPQPSTAKIQT